MNMNMNNMNEIFKKAQKIQKEMMDQQEKLAEQELKGSSGGDMVNVIINGKFEVQRITLDETVFKSQDKEMVEDLIVSAVNDAIKKVQAASQKGYGDLMGKAGLPPNFLGS
ncbi:nucleoid-associated protein, YbaB/EbfC family [Spirochaetota bacterium]|nr:nucleoid-associated protein, YbaB/EbfC family [Spirochaetota bacterium]